MWIVVYVTVYILEKLMLNPFRSEAEAFRFVWLTIGYFALIGSPADRPVGRRSRSSSC